LRREQPIQCDLLRARGLDQECREIDLEVRLDAPLIEGGLRLRMHTVEKRHPAIVIDGLQKTIRSAKKNRRKEQWNPSESREHGTSPGP
jgi:hypothetical protein